jgi:HxlR-like helix-turn-helix
MIQQKAGSKRWPGCPLNVSVKTPGNRWSRLIIRDLMLQGARTYETFLECYEEIAANILAGRLKKLAAHGIIAMNQTSAQFSCSSTASSSSKRECSTPLVTPAAARMTYKSAPRKAERHLSSKATLQQELRVRSESCDVARLRCVGFLIANITTAAELPESSSQRIFENTRFGNLSAV